jgi:hypothetical protein
VALVVDISAVRAIEADFVADVATVSAGFGAIQRFSFSILAPLRSLALTSTVIVETTTTRGVDTAIAPFTRDEATRLTTTFTIDLLSAGTITPLGDLAITATLTVEIATFVAEAYKADAVVVLHTAFITGATVTGEKCSSVTPSQDFARTPTRIVYASARVVCGLYTAPTVFSTRPATCLS